MQIYKVSNSDQEMLYEFFEISYTNHTQAEAEDFWEES